MIALIDADSIIFGCGFAVEHKYYIFYKDKNYSFPTGFVTSKKEVNWRLEVAKERGADIEVEEVKEVEPLENCLYLVKRKMNSILDNVGTNIYKVYIKGTGNFRDEVAVTREYKGNRDKTHRPVYEQQIREYLKEQWGAEEVNGMEVDDKVAIEQYNYSYVEIDSDHNIGFVGESIICSPDKDLSQIPGWHYDYNKQTKFWITQSEADRALFTQILSGDASDNIVGIPGLGPKRAEEALRNTKTRGEMYEVCKKEYQEAYEENWEKVLTEMATLVYIKRSEEDTWTLQKQSIL